MVSPVPPDDTFGRQNRERERLRRDVDDTLRIGGDQYADLARRIQDIEDVQAEQVIQSAAIAAQIAFLQTQSVTDNKSTQYTFGPAGNSGTTWLSFDGTYDCSVSVTTGDSGRIILFGSANMIGASPVLSLLGFEIVGVLSPTVLSPFTAWVTNANAPGARMTVADLAANTTYTIRLRRGMDGSGTALSSWAYQSLVVLRMA